MQMKIEGFIPTLINHNNRIYSELIVKKVNDRIEQNNCFLYLCSDLGLENIVGTAKSLVKNEDGSYDLIWHWLDTVQKPIAEILIDNKLVKLTTICIGNLVKKNDVWIIKDQDFQFKGFYLFKL